MPGYDRTGPLGHGARTGRGLGYCGAEAGDIPPHPSQFERGPGRGYGRGFGWGQGRGQGRGMGRGMNRGMGRGRGRGFGPVFYPVPQSRPVEAPTLSKEDEIAMLKEDLQTVKNHTEAITKRLEELTKDDGE